MGESLPLEHALEEAAKNEAEKKAPEEEYEIPQEDVEMEAAGIDDAQEHEFKLRMQLDQANQVMDDLTKELQASLKDFLESEMTLSREEIVEKASLMEQIEAKIEKARKVKETVKADYDKAREVLDAPENLTEEAVDEYLSGFDKFAEEAEKPVIQGPPPAAEKGVVIQGPPPEAATGKPPQPAEKGGSVGGPSVAGGPEIPLPAKNEVEAVAQKNELPPEMKATFESDLRQAEKDIAEYEGLLGHTEALLKEKYGLDMESAEEMLANKTVSKWSSFKFGLKAAFSPDFRNLMKQLDEHGSELSRAKESKRMAEMAIKEPKKYMALMGRRAVRTVISRGRQKLRGAASSKAPGGPFTMKF